MFQVYLTGMVPLAVQPTRPLHVDFNRYYADIRYNDQLRRFSDKDLWRDAIFAHMEHDSELLMLRLWQCVETNREGRTAPSLDDFVEQPPTTLWSNVAVWSIVLLICVVLVLRLRRVR